MATALERARAKLEALEQEQAERLKEEKKQAQALRLVITRAQAADSKKKRKARTRGLIVLGGWVLRNNPDALAAALQLEQRKDKRKSLEILTAAIKAGEKIDD